jgi:hypothetical protein
MSRRNSDSTTGKTEAAQRRVKKTDATPTSREIAQEAAAIYPDTFDTPPSPEEVAAEAYYIYCERGGEHGRDMDDWFEAERRLSDRRRTQTGVPEEKP